jgi:ABC-type phosphate transport system substrate-binding protein
MNSMTLLIFSLFLMVTFSKTLIKGSGSSATAQAMTIIKTNFNSGSTEFEIEYDSTG